MKRALITIMLATLLASIPVFAGARNERTARSTVSGTYSLQPALPQYRRRYYRRYYRRHERYVARRRYYRRHYRGAYLYRRRRY